MIEVTEDTIAIYFLSLNETSDWMACWHQNRDDWILTYRFRYYRGDQTKQFEESEDEKNWYSMSAPKAKVQRREFEDRVLFVIGELERMTHNEHDVVEMDERGVDGFIEDLQSRSWTQVERRDIH